MNSIRHIKVLEAAIGLMVASTMMYLNYGSKGLLYLAGAFIAYVCGAIFQHFQGTVDFRF
jgi:hypothetical protein